jgi:hypothetical protein
MAAQFRTFTYKQQKFLTDEVAKEAAKGNFAPLARFLTVGGLVGTVTGTARGFLSGTTSSQIKGNQDTPTDSNVGKFLTALNNVGGAGMFSTVTFPLQNLKSERFPQYLAGSVGGPTAGLAVQTATNVGKAASGSPSALERQGLRTTPIAGPILANKLMPYKPAGKKVQAGESEATLKDGAGNPLLDDKGQPETVVVPKGVSGAAKDILVQDATNNAIAKNIKASLSPNEKVLYSQSDARLKSMLDQKKIDQGTYNQIMAYKKVASNVTKAPAVLPPNLDANVKDYINQTSKLTDQGKQNWLKNAKGQALSQKVADVLNGQLPTGIDKLPPSKELLDAYAKFDKSRATAANDPDPRKQWDEIVMRGKLRNFWKNAIEVSQPKDVKEVYGLSMTQLKDYFLANKKVSMEQLKAAVALNDRLLAADLSDSDKYSKKFRAAFGLPEAPEIGSGTGSGGSGGSGSGTGNKYVNIGGKKYQVTANGTPVEVTGSDGQTKIVRVNAEGLSDSPIGLSSLATKQSVIQDCRRLTRPPRSSALK